MLAQERQYLVAVECTREHHPGTGREARERDREGADVRRRGGGRSTSSGVVSIPRRVLATIAPKLPKLCVTPIGEAVLPEVKKMTAGSCGSGAGSSAAGASRSSSASKLGVLPSRAS